MITIRLALSALALACAGVAEAGYVDSGQISCQISSGTIANNYLFANISGATAIPIGVSGSSYLDSAFGSGVGSLLYRSGAGWAALADGSSGQVLQAQGTGVAPQWATASATLTATSPLGATGSNVFVNSPIPVNLGGSSLANPTGFLLYAGAGVPSQVNTITVPNGGSGATALTGYLYGNGTAQFTGSTTIPISALTGTLGVANGGTGLASPTGFLYHNGAGVPSQVSTVTVPNGGSGATSLTGYLYGNGTAQFTGSTTIPSTAISGQMSVAQGGTGVASPTGYAYFNGGGATSFASTIPVGNLSGAITVANGGTGTNTAFTQGSVVFAGAGGAYAQDNSKLFWNDSTQHLGIGTAAPAQALDVGTTGYVRGAAFLGASTTPTVSYGAGAGSGPTTTALIGTMSSGYIQFSTGTSPAVGTVLTLTAPVSCPNYWFVAHQAQNLNFAAANTKLYATSTANTMVLTVGTSALTASASYAFNWVGSCY